jgi:hypothetical protein
MILYKLIGTDGREYGPANADQVRQWIREHRLERQSPVFVPGSTDWTFVGLLPEFADAFPGSAPANPPPPLQSSPPAITVPACPVRSNSMAKAGLICGILAVTIGCCCAGLPFNVLGLVFSVMALVQIADNPRQYGGQGMAILGLVLSAFGFLIFSVALMFH